MMSAFDATTDPEEQQSLYGSCVLSGINLLADLDTDEVCTPISDTYELVVRRRV